MKNRLLLLIAPLLTAVGVTVGPAAVAQAAPTSCWGLMDRRYSVDFGVYYCDAGSGWMEAHALCRRPWSVPSGPGVYAEYVGTATYKSASEAEEDARVNCTNYRPEITDIWLVAWGS